MRKDSQGRPNFRNLFTQQINLTDSKLDLGRAALYLAGEDCPGLDVARYLGQMDAIASDVKSRVEDSQSERSVIQGINRCLFDRMGFTGNHEDYYSPDNSFLHRVLETRRGIPITLSILYIEIARRLGLTCHGVGLPGHFLVGLGALDLYLDPFNSGQLLSAADCRRLVADMFGANLPWHDEYLHPYTKRDILYRALANLRSIRLQNRDYAGAASVIQRMLLINPIPTSLYKDLSWCHIHLNEYRTAIEYLETYLIKSEPAEDTAEVKRQLEDLKAALNRLN